MLFYYNLAYTYNLHYTVLIVLTINKYYLSYLIIVHNIVIYF